MGYPTMKMKMIAKVDLVVVSLFIIQESASGGGGIPALTQEVTWIIDPIDGTTNFVHGFPFSCVSIALASGGQVVAAIIYDPFKDELFLAAKVCWCEPGERRGLLLLLFPLLLSLLHYYYLLTLIASATNSHLSSSRAKGHM